MGLLDNIGGFSSNVESKLGSISSNLNKLSNLAKGVLCLPSMVTGLISSIPNAISNAISGAAGIISGAITGALGAVEDLVNSKIQETVNKINGLKDKLVGAVASVASIISFARGLEDRALDVLNFTANKDDCAFAIAELAKCIDKQVDNSISPRNFKNIANNELANPGSVGGAALPSNGNSIDPLKSRNLTVSSAAKSIAADITSEGGLIDRVSQKQVKCLERAEKIATKVNSII